MTETQEQLSEIRCLSETALDAVSGAFASTGEGNVHMAVTYWVYQWLSYNDPSFRAP